MKKILVVDDEPDIMELLQRQLKARISKEAVIACAEADEAMDKLQAAILRVEQLQSN